MAEEMFRVVYLDNPRHIEELKLMGEELDNDTGRAIFILIYNGTETISEIAEKLDISMQLAGYHVEKLRMAGLIKEREDGSWFSQKGRRVAHYVPVGKAILIVPSPTSFRKAGEDNIKSSFGAVLKKIFYSSTIGVTAFFLLNRLLVALLSTNSTSNARQAFYYSVSVHPGTATAVAHALYTIYVPLAAGLAVGLLSFILFVRKGR